VRPDWVATAVLGGALAGIAFGAAGGTQIGRTTVVEVLTVLFGGAVVAAAVVWGRRGPMYGSLSVLLFAALAAFTALSITWAVVPELAYIEAGRTFAYLAVFAAAVAAARLAPRAAHLAIKGVVLAATAATVYALAARVWPGSIGENEISNRIGQPFEYWNAVGTTAALAIPGLLWLGSRGGGSVAARVAAYPAMGAAILAILLTQSRGALAAAALGAIAWFAIVPLRLRSLPVLLVPSFAAGLVATWALSKDAFAETAQPLAVKESVAGEFGLLLLLMTAVLVLGGLAVNMGRDRFAPTVRVRRRLGIAALVVACAVPLVAFTSVAFSDRGLGGTIEDRVDELTSETDTAPTEQGAGRFAAASSTRGKYWREAGRVFEDRPSVGTGAGNFATTRLRHRTDASVTRHAHGFVPQTLADLGIVGVALTTALLLAWLVAAARATSLYPRRLPFADRLSSGRDHDEPPPRRDWTPERAALVALGLIAVVFGLQSAIDWTWFVPGPAAMALVAAGFVAGRGPATAGFAIAGPAVPSGAHGSAAGPSAVPARGRMLDFREPFRNPSVPRLLAAGAVLLAAILTAWAIWPPNAADRQTSDALALADDGDLDGAIAKARDAADTNPLSAEPLLVEAAIATRAGREAEAEDALEQAVLKFPGDPETWYRLAAFQLGTLDEPTKAAQTIRGALYLDPHSQAARQLFLEARASAREEQLERSSP
jgi:O-antigen ligase/polysaccharide polymerase Wzy-like membrane protein